MSLTGLKVFVMFMPGETWTSQALKIHSSQPLIPTIKRFYWLNESEHGVTLFEGGGFNYEGLKRIDLPRMLHVWNIYLHFP